MFLQEKYRTVKRYFINIWKFRKELADFYPWNFDFGLLRRTLELNMMAIIDGYEVAESRNKKIKKMERAIYILKLFETEDFIEEAEKELNLKYTTGDFRFVPVEDQPTYSTIVFDNVSDEQEETNKKISERAKVLELELWPELWEIIKGQDYNDYVKLHEENGIDYTEWFDGSGIRGWWN